MGLLPIGLVSLLFFVWLLKLRGGSLGDRVNARSPFETIKQTKRSHPPETTMKFEVYTFFGRVLDTFPVKDDETHHRAAEAARISCFKLEKSGTKCWVRMIK